MKVVHIARKSILVACDYVLNSAVITGFRPQKLNHKMAVIMVDLIASGDRNMGAEKQKHIPSLYSQYT